MTPDKPLIQDIFKRGQEVIVQVIKEGIGTKGPTLSTYISIAGRYLVLMPDLNRIGVSRKIEDDEHRRRLREIFNELKPPRGLGFIIRTAAIDKNKQGTAARSGLPVAAVAGRSSGASRRSRRRPRSTKKAT